MNQNGSYKAKLVDVSKITGTPTFFLAKPVVNIGRKSTNDFVIKEKTVSGKHAVIELKAEGYFIADLNSTNGTRVNGVKVEPESPHKLGDGDVIYFDKFSFVFQLETTVYDQPTRLYDQTIDIGSGPLSDGAKERDAAPSAGPAYSETIDIDSKPLATGTGEHEKAPVSDGPAYAGTIDIDSEPLTVSGEATIDQTAKPDDTGTNKIGNYDTVKLLGRGGFGSVWKATDSKGKPVAIKLLNPEALENERAVRKFFHEAIILSKLDHPNICRFIDFFPHNQNFAIVMDFVQGTDMKDMLKERQGPLPFEMACKIAKQTLDAFHYAHQQAVLHRDIKPENITLDQNGEVRIMDFGIAKLSSAETQHTSAAMISPAYTSPERFDINNVVTHRSDIYSLGIFFYEIFTGRHPYKASTPVEMITAHLRAVPTPPHELVEIPEEMSRAILKSLEKRPEDRFEDFADFKAAMLGQDVEESPSAGAPPGTIEFADEHYPYGAKLLEKFVYIIQSYHDTGKKFTLSQEGSRVELVIETVDGDPIRIQKDLKQLIEEAGKGAG